jgi:hypothetical protein
MKNVKTHVKEANIKKKLQIVHFILYTLNILGSY